MAIAEAISFISAAFKAIELYKEYGPSRDEVMTTLNLEYKPERFRALEKRLLDLNPQYDALFAEVKKQVEKCFQKFMEDGYQKADRYLPSDREKFGDAGARCICEKIKMAKDFMASNLPPEFSEVWLKHGCGRFYPFEQEFVSFPGLNAVDKTKTTTG